MKIHKDKHGIRIKAGDTLFNPSDRDKEHLVIIDRNGDLFLGDLEYPLENYQTDVFWEIVENIKL